MYGKFHVKTEEELKLAYTFANMYLLWEFLKESDYPDALVQDRSEAKKIARKYFNHLFSSIFAMEGFDHFTQQKVCDAVYHSVDKAKEVLNMDDLDISTLFSDYIFV